MMAAASVCAKCMSTATLLSTANVVVQSSSTLNQLCLSARSYLSLLISSDRFAALDTRSSHGSRAWWACSAQNMPSSLLMEASLP